MKIGGIQKTSLLDYPDVISAIVWTIGCNFRCPFCYNKDIVLGNVHLIPEKEIISFLKKRKGLIEGLVITGGEPFLQKDLSDFCEKVKKLSYLIKVDTNGMYPKELKKLLEKNLIDYIAMDIKAPKKKYEKLTNIKLNIKKIEESIKLLQNSKIDYEFRTTFVPKLLSKDDIIEIAKWLEGSKKFYLQQFKPNIPLISGKLEDFIPYTKKDLVDTLEEIKSYFDICQLRGI
ncbi:MAG: anaerobic ribonucleoside-triphosphate reductase activating protein [Thermoplasmatales archaeon SG8-52-3]|nr:MAG: anaerobic ribonucleoside-triphosphate reductase activating protein [Thermoplasmatales archaeon SG8-52-3]